MLKIYFIVVTVVCIRLLCLLIKLTIKAPITSLALISISQLIDVNSVKHIKGAIRSFNHSLAKVNYLMNILLLFS